MTYPVRNQSTQTNEADDLYNDLGYDTDYDPELDGGETEGEGDVQLNDEFGMEDEQPGDPGGYVPQTPNDMRNWLKDLLNEGKITQAEYETYMGQVNHAASLSGTALQEKLAEIATAITTKFADDITGGEFGEDGETPTPNVDEFKKEVQDFLTLVEGSENLTEDEKIELKSQAEKMLNDIELAAGDPAKLAELDIEGMKGELEDLKTAFEEQNQYSPAIKALANGTDLDLEVIKQKAEAAGINLENPTLNMELLEFLQELDPSLKEKFDAVEDAISDRTKFYNDNKRAAESTNTNNAKCTSDTDNTDMSPFQNLYSLKYHQDEKSNAVKSAMAEAVGALQPYLEAIFAGQDVGKVEVSGFSGWQKDHEEYKVADQIKIGGTTFDLFNNTDGTLQVSSSPDSEPLIETVTIKYDNEGDGEWRPEHAVDTYGDGEAYGSTYVAYDDP